MDRKIVTRLRCVSLAAACAACTAVPMKAAYAQVAVVVIEGDAAPDLPGAAFAELSDTRASLNNLGQVAFSADLTLGAGGVTAASRHVLYRYSAVSGARLIARAGDTIPVLGQSYDAGGPRFAGVQSLNDFGQIAFHAGIGGGLNGLFVNGATLVTATTIQAPGLSPGVVVAGLGTGALDSARINNSAQVLHTVQVAGAGITPSNNTLLYRNDTIIAREGDIAPGTGASFGTFVGVDRARMNASGGIVFATELAATGAPTNGVLYRHTQAGGLELLARDGAVAPNTGGALFSGAGFQSSRINASGQVAYLADLANGQNILYVDTTVVARDGGPAPGLPGMTLADVGGTAIGGNLAFHDGGAPLFVSRITGPGVSAENDLVLYLGKQFMGRTGTTSPISGTTFTSFGSGDLALNAGGQFALVAGLAGASVSVANDRVLLMWDGAGWRSLAREGDTLAGSTIGALVGGDASPRIEVNESGQVLFWASLADGRDGLFLTTPIPEPAAVWSLIAGLLVVGWRFRARGRHRPAELRAA